MNKRGRANSSKKCRDLSSNGCLILSVRKDLKFVIITITVVRIRAMVQKGVKVTKREDHLRPRTRFRRGKNFFTERATNEYRYFGTEGCVEVKRGGTAENTGT